MINKMTIPMKGGSVTIALINGERVKLSTGGEVTMTKDEVLVLARKLLLTTFIAEAEKVAPDASEEEIMGHTYDMDRRLKDILNRLKF